MSPLDTLVLLTSFILGFILGFVLGATTIGGAINDRYLAFCRKTEAQWKEEAAWWKRNHHRIQLRDTRPRRREKRREKYPGEKDSPDGDPDETAGIPPRPNQELRTPVLPHTPRRVPP